MKLYTLEVIDELLKDITLKTSVEYSNYKKLLCDKYKTDFVGEYANKDEIVILTRLEMEAVKFRSVYDDFISQQW